MKNISGILLISIYLCCGALFAQEEKVITYGFSLNVGTNSTSSKGESFAPSVGLGALLKIKKVDKSFNIIRVDYSIKQEKFENLTHYKWTDGQLIISSADIYKNYGIINLNYSFNYYLIQNPNLSLFASIGIGINDLFWLKTRIDIPDNEDEITNGKTQFIYTNPISRPSLNGGFGIILPYEGDKMIAFKPEINYDYRLPFAKNTYPNFLTYSLRILLLF